MNKLAIVDFETTGLDEYRNEIIEASILNTDEEQLIEREYSLDDIEVVRTLPRFPEYAFEKNNSMICAADINGFSVDRWKNEIDQIPILVIDSFLDWIDERIDAWTWVGANPHFDYRFYRAMNHRINRTPVAGKYLVDISMVGLMMKQRGIIKSCSLNSMAKYFLGEEQGKLHSSKRDVYLTVRIYQEIYRNVELSGLSHFEASNR